MKKPLALLLLLLTISWSSFAQAPNIIPYQAVARNSAGNILANKSIILRMSIRNNTISGPVVYSEIHAITTTSLGLVNINIGQGSPITSTISSVNWSNGDKFLQVEIDTALSGSYIDMGTSQLNSVPYALFAANGVVSGTSVGQMLFWNGSSWITIPTGSNGQVLTLVNGIPSWQTLGLPAIGQPYQGGLLAYVLKNGDIGYDPNVPHGLIVAPTDQSSAAPWGCIGLSIPGATGTAIGTGAQNTIAISTACPTGGVTAADICSILTLGGYSDWYLPSKEELNVLYQNVNVVSGMFNNYYWSSTQYDSLNGWLQGFGFGSIGVSDKSLPNCHVRAIRSF